MFGIVKNNIKEYDKPQRTRRGEMGREMSDEREGI